jgi:sugar phosphate isomerase/epimerase
MNPISFITANYVGREVGFYVTEGWGQGDRATNAYFAPIATYAERFDALLSQIRGLGFESIDLWMAHLHYSWATPDHLAIARDALTRHGLVVHSLAGGFGATRDELASTCRIAQALGVSILAGSCALLHNDRATALAVLKEHGIRLALENHPNEKTPADILEQIGDDAGVLGTAVDTGWWGTNGYNAADAIRELRPHILAVHLKDVRAPGGHLTCVYGQGVVPIEECVRELVKTGYTGAFGVEHEPFEAPHHSYDPSAECAQMLQMVRGWLASS